jgi:hypothetical protein
MTFILLSKELYYYLNIKTPVVKMVKQSRYRPGVAQSVPES